MLRARLRPKEGQLCPQCPLYDKGIPVYDRESADPECRLLLVGELPGKEEVKQKFSFVGSSGKMLDTLLKMLEIPPPHITNSVRCGLAHGAKPSDKNLAAASKCCHVLTNDLIGVLRPKVTMAIGGTALEHLCGLRGIEAYRGCCWKDVWTKFEETRLSEMVIVDQLVDEWWYITTCSIHPAGLLKKDEKRVLIELLRDDLAKAWDLATGRRQLWFPNVGDAANVEELLTFLDECHRRREMSVDVETTGLDALTCALRTIGVGTSEIAYSIPWPGYFWRYWRAEDWRRVMGKLRAVFADEEMHLVFSNKIFDVPVLRQRRYFGDGIRAVCDDVLLRHHAVYPKVPHDLQSMASQFLPLPPWKSEFHDTFGEWGDASDRVDSERASALFWYNAADVASTAYINDALKAQIVTHDVEKVYDSDRQMVDVAIDWFRRGILIDVKQLKHLARQYRSGDPENPGVVDKLEASIMGYATEAGMPDFNPASPVQLGELLYERLRLPVNAVTKTGKLSTAKEQLYKIFHAHPIIPTLIKFRKEAQLYSTYLNALEGKMHADGRLHSVGNITSTPSGRFGFSPAIQNWPAGKKPGEINMKTMMIATPGTKYVGADFSALELRFFALLAGEKKLIELFNDGADVHMVHAAAFFGAAFKQADAAGRKILRYRGKPVTFGKIYGGGPDTLFMEVLPDRLDEDPKDVLREVKHMSEVFDGMYPMMTASGDYFLRQAKENFNIRTLLTHRLRKFPMGDPSLTVARNHPVQGGASDIVNYATLRWINELKAAGVYWKSVWPVLQIHDYLSAEVLEENAAEEAERLGRCLYTELTVTSPISGSKNSMKFPVDVFISDTAAEPKS